MAEKFWYGSDEKSTHVHQKNWFGTDGFCRVNDFAPSVLDQNFTSAQTMSRGTPSTDKIGTQS